MQSIAGFVFERSGSERLAAAYVDRIDARCQKIGDAPRGGRPRDDLRPGLRTVPFEHSAVIAYVIEDGRILVTNIFYGGRDVEAFFHVSGPDAAGD